MKRIIVSVTNDLVTDQRVHKVCTTLTQMNFEILLIGRKLKNSDTLNRAYKTCRLKLLFNKGPLFYAEYNIRLFFKLLFLKKDILLANDLDTLLPNYLNSVISKSKLVYDSHELFTEVPELTNRPFVKKFWLQIEKFIFPKLKNCYTVSNLISEYYHLKYNTNFQIIRNLPFKIKNISQGVFPFETNDEKIILYQGAVNKERGLELMIETMQYLQNSIFVIVGSGDIENQIHYKIKDLCLEQKVKLIPRISPEALQKLTPLADVGISFEEDSNLNYTFALPNKLFDYIQANVPVIVSDLPEMKNIVIHYNIGEVIKNRAPKELATQLNEILIKGKNHYKIQLQNAANEFNWENESKKLIEIFKNLE